MSEQGVDVSVTTIIGILVKRLGGYVEITEEEIISANGRLINAYKDFKYIIVYSEKGEENEQITT